ncbi:MAG: class I SAM-dependent methyltransferase [Microthrixaceae bacterium]
MAADHWFEDLADHMGPAYLRYSFTKGTSQEVGFLVEELGLEPGMRVLDVGCGPGRHTNALAALGIETVGLDISQRFVDVGASAGVDGATFVRGDARAMAFDQEFDAAISLCQGAFGLGGPPQSLDPFNLDNDAAVLAGIWRALRPGGRVALTAFERVLPGEVARGPRPVRRGHRRQPRTHRGARRGGGRPYPPICGRRVTHHGSSDSWSNARVSTSPTSGRSAPGPTPATRPTSSITNSS